MNEEQINAAKAAWQRDPETAAQALLGMSAEEVFIQAIRGCNQHKHKPGCPEADGGGDKRWDDKNKKQFAASVVEKSDSMYNALHRAWQNKGTDFLRKAGINIGDAAAAYSRARGAARFIMNNPSSDRWDEALKDMQKNVSELEEMYKDLKGTKD